MPDDSQLALLQPHPRPSRAGGQECARVRGRGGRGLTSPTGKESARHFSSAIHQVQTGPSSDLPAPLPGARAARDHDGGGGLPSGPRGSARRARPCPLPRCAVLPARAGRPLGLDLLGARAQLPASAPAPGRRVAPGARARPAPPPPPRVPRGRLRRGRRRSAARRAELGGAGGGDGREAGLREGDGERWPPADGVQRDNCRKWPVRSFRGSLAPARALEGRGPRRGARGRARAARGCCGSRTPTPGATCFWGRPSGREDLGKPSPRGGVCGGGGAHAPAHGRPVSGAVLRGGAAGVRGGRGLSPEYGPRTNNRHRWHPAGSGAGQRLARRELSRHVTPPGGGGWGGARPRPRGVGGGLGARPRSGGGAGGPAQATGRK